MIVPSDYQFLTALLRENSGLALDDGKHYLVESRLAPLAASCGFASLPALLRALRTARDPQLVREVCEAMATHESLFFRDHVPFQMLRDRILPALMAARQATRQLRIWSAGASTGQEPYSIAMTILDEVPALSNWSVEILATDFSESALARARAGIYTQFEAQRGLSPQRLAKYFSRAGADWQIDERVRRMVVFRQENLLHPLGARGAFDVVFCRNVLIYFDVPTKRSVLERLGEALTPDGYVVLGSAETAVGLTERLTRIADMPTSIYRSAGSCHSSASEAVRAAS
jgi:chemotaxis protein methyltransferase CheR